MKIGIDFDGVVSDCGRLKHDGAKARYGVDIPPEMFKTEIVVGRGLLTKDQYRELQTAIYETREYGFLMKPVEGALEFIPRLSSEGNSVTVITSRINDALEIAEEWSGRQGLNLDFVGVGHGVSKASALKGFDVYIDDDLDKLEPLVGVVQHRFLFSWGYNRHIDAGEVAVRTPSWEDFYRRISALKNT